MKKKNKWNNTDKKLSSIPEVDQEKNLHQKYKDILIKEEYPFTASTYRLYYGTLQDSIDAFESKYGDIDGKIYWHKHVIGITGTQVKVII